MADILTLQQQCQAIVDQWLLQANSKQVSHDYSVNERISKKNIFSLLDKLKLAFSGPFPITEVYTNGFW